MDVADALYAEYGEKAGGGIRGGKQDPLFTEGNAFLLREFPKLDYIRRATGRWATTDSVRPGDPNVMSPEGFDLTPALDLLLAPNLTRRL